MALLRMAVSALRRANQVRPAGRNVIIGTGAGAGQFVGSPITYLAAYGNVGWLYAVVSRIAEAVATATWRLYQTGKGERREIDRHVLLDLWRQPNPFFSGQEFVETFQQHLDLVGEAWWILVANATGRIAEIWTARPDRMTPIPHPTEWLSGYVYRSGSEVIPLQIDDVIFLRRPNPIDPYRGMGPVQTILADLDSEKYAALWNRNFFLNSAEPGGIIELDEALDDAEFERWVLRWREQHLGVANAHRVAILERGKWVDRKFTMRDMQFEQMRKINRDIILGAYGMPMALLGISETVNRANAEAAEVMFSRWVVRPRLERIRQALNERLVPHFSDNLEFDFDSVVPEDQEHHLKVSLGSYELGISTRNEARQLIGLGAVEEGNTINPYLGLALKGKDEYRSKPEELEEKMAESWERRLGEEAEAVIAYLRRVLPPAKAVMDDYDWDWWAHWGEAVILELIAVFSTISSREGLPTSTALELAVRYAQERAARLLHIDGDLALVTETRQRVARLVSEAIANSDSVDTLARRLRTDFVFSKQRARMIARTETATAWGQASLDAGRFQGREEKRWVTQGDSLVSPECQRNGAASWIPIEEAFPTGKETTPQHPNCRCGLRTRHRPKTSAGVRCPKCGHRLPVGELRGSVSVYCRRCKEVVVLEGLDN